MPANFPNNPAINQLYSYSGATWKFTGTKWQLVTVTDGNTGTLFTYSNTAPQAPSLGDRWLNSETLRQSIYINDGDTDQWVEPVSIGLAGAAKSLNNLANVSINTSLLPAANVTHDLGSSSLRWRDLYLSGNSIILGAATLTSTGSAVNLPAGTTVGGQNVATSGDVSTGGGPKITNLQITDNSWAVLDDTAVDTAGGYVLITGTNFVSGALVYLNQTPATSVAFVSATTLRVTVPALTAGTYVVYVINPDGGTAIRVPGLTASANPAWQTASALPEQYDGVAITLNLVATEATTYTLTSGSLPPGLSLNSNTGVITGTVTGVTVDTTYTFTVRATDAQLQDSPRTFTVTITVSDPYFKLTTLLLSGSAVSANAVVRDSSTNNFNLTVFGDARASNFTPYGTGWSVQFDGTGDYIVANNPSIGTGDFAIESWAYFLTVTGDTIYRTIYSNYGSGGAQPFIFGMYVNTIPYLLFYDGVTSNIGVTPLVANTWYHFLATRRSGVLKLFLNGVLEYTGANTINISAGTARIGMIPSASQTGYMNGYISNLRVCIGFVPTDYHTTSTTIGASIFTVANSNLSNISQGAAGVQLLACQSNRFIDNSTNNTALVRNGDAAVRAFNPFNITNTGVNGSMYFDGTGDYVGIPSTSALDLSGDFTIETWIYLMDNSAERCIFHNHTSDSNGIALTIRTGNVIRLLSGNGTWAVIADSGAVLPLYSWNHIAFTRNGNTFTGWLNGVSVVTASSSAVPNYSGDAQIGRFTSGLPLAWLGYMSNFRVVKGTAVYTANFIPPTQPLTAVANTQLLTLQYDQPHNNHTFLDSSSNQFLITRNGNASQGTFSPFSQAGWSSYFNGSDAYLSYTQAGSTYPSQLSFLNGASATGTIECWVYPLSSSQGTNPAEAPAILAVGDTYFSLNVTTTNKARFYWYTTVVNNLDSTASVPFNAWTHIAAVRNGASVTLYINGASSGSIAYTGWNWASGANGSQLKIGYHAPYSTARYFNGYISNLRIINGTALYTANFTPATSSLTAITNTSLLVCHSNRFVDSSVSNTVFTVSGTPQVQAFSPFAPTAVYNPAVHGGSAYFDGSDTLTFSREAVNNLSTNNFTWECWVYRTAVNDTTYADAICCSVTNYTGLAVGIDPAGKVGYAIGNTAAGNNWNIRLGVDPGNPKGFITVPLNSWTHVALVRNGTQFVGFVNGAVDQSFTSSDAVGNIASDYYIGRWHDAYNRFWIGYISNIRLVKGANLYPTSTTTNGTQIFNPPLSPFTSTKETAYLFNFTDAAILDSTGRNVLETVADARSTSVVTKFTGGSMYFDGASDYLDTAGSSANALGSGDWTIEFWLYLNSLTNTNIIDYRSASVLSNTLAVNYNANRMELYINNSTTVIQGNALSASTWYHIAVSKSGSSTKMFVNGTQAGSTYTDTNNYAIGANRPRIGSGGDSPSNHLNGYLSDLRITRGYARYTANFTAPTAPARLK